MANLKIQIFHFILFTNSVTNILIRIFIIFFIIQKNSEMYKSKKNNKKFSKQLTIESNY
jgi:hypothetical protein